MKFTAVLGLAAAVVVGTGGIAAAQAPANLDTKKFNVVGTWNFLNLNKMVEVPFWNEQLGAASGGKLTGNLKSITELNLKGTEVLRLLKTGIYDVAHALPIYVDDGAAVFEASDLSGVATSVAQQREILNAWLPEMQKTMRDKFGAQIVGTFAFPQQVFYCRDEISSLADLKGKKVRVQGVSQSDLVKALGGSAVTIPFGEVVPALEKGVVDCGITGTLPGYQAKWPEVVKTVVDVSLGYTAGFVAVNLNAWNKLSKPTQEFMTAQFKKLEDASWASVEKDTKEGIACNTGNGPCSVGAPAKLKLVTPSDADRAAVKKALNDAVLPEWAKRCGAECAAKWTETVGKKYGLTAKAN
ncbi:MAG: TRAP transporter substrate-binding protein [Reyranella sp.]|nr:TRAP transporter substrate-binding protein [Reyranella sp.]